MDRERVTIRARGLGGLWVPLGLGFTVVWAVLMAYVSHIATNRYAFRLWVIVIVVCLVSTFGFELIVRRTFIEVGSERIRYFFRLQKLRGDRPLGDVRGVDGYGVIKFRDGGVVFLDDEFRRKDKVRLIDAIKRLNPKVETT